MAYSAPRRTAREKREKGQSRWALSTRPPENLWEGRWQFSIHKNFVMVRAPEIESIPER